MASRRDGRTSPASPRRAQSPARRERSSSRLPKPRARGALQPRRAPRGYGGGAHGGGATLRLARGVAATGAPAAAPPIEGLGAAGSRTNETVFSLTEQPRSLAVIGAGPIGCELAQAFRRLGCEVVAFDILPQILGREDEDAAALVRRTLESDGVRFVLESEIRRVERTPDGKTLHFAVGGREDRVTVDEILIGAGRAPNVEDLGLDVVGVAHDTKRGVHVDDRLRTSNPAIFAAGDVCLSAKFTHLADFSARI